MITVASEIPWLRSSTASYEAEVVEVEEYESEASPPTEDGRTRILQGLLSLVSAEDRDLLLSTMDGRTIASVASRQSLTGQALSYRRVLLVDWLVYCAPLTMQFEPLLSNLDLTPSQLRWWVLHAGGTGPEIASLLRRHPGLEVDPVQWRAPIRSEAKSASKKGIRRRS